MAVGFHPVLAKTTGENRKEPSANSYQPTADWIMTMPLTTAQTARDQFAADGFYLSPGPVVPRELIERVIPHMDAVMDCKYETGQAPKSRMWNPGDSPTKLRKLDDTHISDRTIHELISHPA